ncbi:MAG TPA: exopolysaccharide biosynthesis protein, partial [Dongiaceae bacterium]
MTEMHAARGRRLGDVLAEISQGSNPEIRLGELIEAIGDRGHGLLIAAFALPNVLPIYLPGLSAVFGLPLIFVALQLVLGRHRLWLPRALLRRSVSRALIARLAVALAPWLARL